MLSGYVPSSRYPGRRRLARQKRLLFEPGRVRHSRARSARVVRPDAEFGAEKCVSRRSRAHDDASASTRVSRARLSSRARRSRSPPSPEPVRTSPADSKFTQQELPAWRPTLTPAWVRFPRSLPRPSGVRVRAARAARRALPEDARSAGRRRSVLPPTPKQARTFPGRARVFFLFLFSSRVARSNADLDRTAPDHSITIPRRRA